MVCFLDYNDFFNYNFPMGDPFPANLPRPGISVGEATRLIILKLRITHMEPPGPDDGQELPVVHFTGDSRLLDDGWDANASSELKGESFLLAIPRLSLPPQLNPLSFLFPPCRTD